MPGPLVIQKPELNASINPAGASVFDAPGQGMLRKIVGWLGLDDPQQIMNVGIAMDVGPMGGGLLEKIAERYPRFANAIKAYHGSPHDFEAFDTSKIGTGEGAQAYGHGLYFAEAPEVAQQYRDALKWRGSNWDDPAVIAGRVLEEHKGDKAAAIAQLVEANQRNLGFKASEAGNVARQQAIDMLKAGDPLKGAANPGRMYEVGINAHPDQFLDWDKPLSQQPQPVKDALAAKIQALKDRGEILMPSYMKQYEAGTLSGEQVYHGIGDGTKESSAEALRAAGIPGIKYLDQGSRAMPYRGDPAFLHAAQSFKDSGAAPDAALAGLQSAYPKASMNDLHGAVNELYGTSLGQTRNFVVFDAKTVDILKKYGLLLPAAGAGLAASQPPPTPTPGDQ